MAAVATRGPHTPVCARLTAHELKTRAAQLRTAGIARSDVQVHFVDLIATEWTRRAEKRSERKPELKHSTTLRHVLSDLTEASLVSDPHDENASMRLIADIVRRVWGDALGDEVAEALDAGAWEPHRTRQKILIWRISEGFKLARPSEMDKYVDAPEDMYNGLSFYLDRQEAIDGVVAIYRERRLAGRSLWEETLRERAERQRARAEQRRADAEQRRAAAEKERAAAEQQREDIDRELAEEDRALEYYAKLAAEAPESGSE